MSKIFDEKGEQNWVLKSKDRWVFDGLHEKTDFLQFWKTFYDRFLNQIWKSASKDVWWGKLTFPSANNVLKYCKHPSSDSNRFHSRGTGQSRTHLFPVFKNTLGWDFFWKVDKSESCFRLNPSSIEIGGYKMIDVALGFNLNPLVRAFHCSRPTDSGSNKGKKWKSTLHHNPNTSSNDLNTCFNDLYTVKNNGANAPNNLNRSPHDPRNEYFDPNEGYFDLHTAQQNAIWKYFEFSLWYTIMHIVYFHLHYNNFEGGAGEKSTKGDAEKHWCFGKIGNKSMQLIEADGNRWWRGWDPFTSDEQLWRVKKIILKISAFPME